MRSCAICKKKFGKGNGHLFRAPKELARRSRWSEICGKSLLASHLICVDHFLPKNVAQTGKTATLLPNAEPFFNKNSSAVDVVSGSDFATYAMDDKHSKTIEQNSFANVYCPMGEELSCAIATNHLPSSFTNGCYVMGEHPSIDLAAYTQMKQNSCYLMGEQPSTDVPDYPKMQTKSFPNVCYNVGEQQSSCQIQQPLEAHYKEQGTQTEVSCIAVKLMEQVRSLQSEKKELELKLKEANKAIDAMRAIFTEGQIRKLMSPRSILWRWEDVSNAICLHAAGPRAYNHLYKKGFPLPHVTTLQRWCAKVDVTEGILKSSIEFMRRTTDLTSDEKICVLAFDEMKVTEVFEYEPVADVVKKPTNYVQVVMARGLRKSWKQPVFYDFDCKMSKEILSELIHTLYEAGFPVVAIVCDLGPNNRKLWKDLGVCAEKPWFSSPVGADQKVFVFADVPHLIKLIRNHFLDTGLLYDNQIVSSRTIADLLKLCSRSDLSIVYKIVIDIL